MIQGLVRGIKALLNIANAHAVLGCGEITDLKNTNSG